MKNSFKSFQIPERASVEAAWSSKRTLFVFDTNVFLNLYGYEESTRKDFFKLLEQIKEKVWIPHQVGLEYHRRRLDVIKNEKRAFREITTELEKIPSDIEKKLTNASLNKKIPELSTHINSLINAIQKEVSKCNGKIKEWDKLQPDVRSNDEILDNIDLITNNKIGEPPKDQAWLDDLYTEGADRYKKKLPPGFCDKTKADGAPEETIFFHNNLKYERQYGDLILWKQLLNKLIDSDIDNVILITDDIKKDWWHKIDSAGEKIIGPNEGLKSEIYRDTKISLFHMYTSSAFLEDSNKILNANISNSSIEDTQDKSHFYLDLTKTKTTNADKTPNITTAYTIEQLREQFSQPSSPLYRILRNKIDALSNIISAQSSDKWKQRSASDLGLEEFHNRGMHEEIAEAREILNEIMLTDPHLGRRALKALNRRYHQEDLEAMRQQGLPLSHEEYRHLLEIENHREYDWLNSRDSEKKDAP